MADENASFVVKKIINDFTADVMCMQYSPDDAFLAVGCKDGIVRIYNAETGLKEYSFNTAGSNKIQFPVTALAWRPFHSKLLSGVLLCAGNEGEVQSWSLKSGTQMNSPIIANAMDAYQNFPDFAIPPLNVTSSPDSLASKSSKPFVSSHQYSKSLSATSEYSSKSFSSSFSDDYEQQKNDASYVSIFALDFSKDGKFFATAGKDGSIRVYDSVKQNLIICMKGGDNLQTIGHANRIFSVKWHPVDPNIIISGGWDNTIQIWDKRKNHAVRRIFGPHIVGDSIDISEDGTEILTGSWRPNNPLQIWDYETGNLLETIDIPKETSVLSNTTKGQSSIVEKTCNIYAAKMHSASGIIAYGGSGVNEMRILKRKKNGGKGARTLGSICNLKKPVYALSISASGKNVACGTSDGSIFILTQKI